MNILKAPQASILAALQVVAGVVPSRSTLPILSNILMQKDADTLRFTASDLEIQIRTTVALDGDSGNVATSIASRKVMDILKSLSGDQVVTLASGADSKLTLKAGKSKFTIQTLPAADFPLVNEDADFGEPIELTQKTFRGLIDQVHFAMAVQDVRYFLNGLLLSISGTELTAVATDGTRLAVAKASLPAALAAQEVILPRKAVLELQKLLTDDDATVTFAFSTNQARFKFGSVEFITKLVAGKFPDFNRAIPKSLPHTLSLSRAGLLSALKRAAVMTSDKFKGVRLKFSPGVLNVSASTGAEDAEHDLEIEYDGDPLEVGMDVRLLIEGLSNFSSDMMGLQFGDKLPFVITFQDHDAFRYVVSPMRI